MSDCSISIGGGDYDGCAEFYDVTELKARKIHKCGECRAEIPIGAKYRKIVGKFDGDFFSFRCCLPCAEITSVFVDGAFNLVDLWQEMRDYGFQNFNEGCLTKLETSAAKQKMVDQWRKWKGL